MKIYSNGTAHTAKLIYRFILPMLVPVLCIHSQAQQGTAHTTSLPDNIETVGRSVVRVQRQFFYRLSTSNQDANFISSGTGFMVDIQGYVATANHVVGEPENLRLLQASLSARGLALVPGSFRGGKAVITIQLPNAENGVHHNEIYDVSDTSDAVIVKQDPELDIAILEARLFVTSSRPSVAIHLSRAVPTFYTGPLRAGQTVSVSGYPAVGGLEEGIPGLTTNTGTIANPYFKDNANRNFILADFHVNHGDSGGPVFDSSTGAIIGFADAYLNTVSGENSGLSEIVPIKKVLDVVRSLTR